MLVHRTKEKKVFWEFDSIIMQNMSHNLLLFCASLYHVIENHLYLFSVSYMEEFTQVTDKIVSTNNRGADDAFQLHSTIKLIMW